MAILAEEETREEEKDRRDKVKYTLARKLLMELRDVLVLQW